MRLFSVHGARPAEKILRFLGVLCVFALVAYGFWTNNQRSLQSIQDQGVIWDQTKTLTPEHKEALLRFARAMKSQYGITVRIRITTDSIILPTMDSKTLMIALCPPRREARVVFPPLLRHALGPGVEAQLEGPELLPYWENNAWPQGLAHIVLAITEHTQRLGHRE